MNASKTFLWGVSTSSYQVEGDITNNDWDFFTRSQQISKRISTITKPSIFYKGGTQVDLQPAGDATKFWDAKYYKRDFDLARSLGLNAFRMSIEWARIEPEKDHWDQVAIDHYKGNVGRHAGKKSNASGFTKSCNTPSMGPNPPSGIFKKNGSKFATTSTKGPSTRRSVAIRSLLEFS